MSSKAAIWASGLGKSYRIYARPIDRLKQLLTGRKRKYYSEFPALNDVSFEIMEGETVGVIGQNGSGKSTLLQIICGTLNNTSGSIGVKGRVAALLELGSGFNPEFTGRENIYLNATILGLTQSEIEDRMEAIVEFSEIGTFVDRPVKTYSSGMYLRLAFAVIAHVDADVLIIDEALSVGDAYFTQKCMRFLRKFQKNGTVFFVSHDSGSIISLCNRAIWLENGTVMADGPPKTVTERYLKFLFERQQGDSEDFKCEVSAQADSTTSAVDMRLPFLNTTQFRNDIELFPFHLPSTQFGKGLAKITNVFLVDTDGNPLAWVVGGERVELIIDFSCHASLFNVIAGFMVNDKTGQTLFSDNTYLSYAQSAFSAESGDALQARFCFRMPILPVGDYSISVSIAEGTQLEHVQHHWIHDAVIFRSQTSSVCTGLVGVFMEKIEIRGA